MWGFIYLFCHVLAPPGSLEGASSSSQVGEAVIRGVMLAAWTCSRDGELRSAKVCVCVCSCCISFLFFLWTGVIFVVGPHGGESDLPPPLRCVFTGREFIGSYRTVFFSNWNNWMKRFLVFAEVCLFVRRSGSGIVSSSSVCFCLV